MAPGTQGLISPADDVGEIGSLVPPTANALGPPDLPYCSMDFQFEHLRLRVARSSMEVAASDVSPKGRFRDLSLEQRVTAVVMILRRLCHAFIRRRTVSRRPLNRCSPSKKNARANGPSPDRWFQGVWRRLDAANGTRWEFGRFTQELPVFLIGWGETTDTMGNDRDAIRSGKDTALADM